MALAVLKKGAPRRAGRHALSDAYRITMKIAGGGERSVTDVKNTNYMVMSRNSQDDPSRVSILRENDDRFGFRVLLGLPNSRLESANYKRYDQDLSISKVHR